MRLTIIYAPRHITCVGMRVVWYSQADALISDRVRRVVEAQVARLPQGRLLRLREYEMTGDALVLDRPRPEEGLVVKVVRHRGRLALVAELLERGYSEEYYVAELRP